MKANYLVQIDNPQNNLVKVTLKLQRPKGKDSLQVFLPSWSPGSYLMREYARHIRWFKAGQENGEELFYTQMAKGVWEIDWKKSNLKSPQEAFEVSYEVYCKELTVRTSHVDINHAYLQGPTYLMGVMGESLDKPTIEFRFPPSWSKLTTGLKDISQKREVFLYEAPNYDELLDSPVEIGCHETDGFEFQGKAHHLAHSGELYPHRQNIKADMKKVVETVAKHFNNELPYDQYVFITHFAPKIYGGLEHLNSTVLQFDGRKLQNKKDYQMYLSLAAHEYFHLWNVKRIRPKELGPFDYLNENYTTLLWLAEGLTSFMDDLFVYRAGLSTLEEYLDVVKGNLDTYLGTPGRYYHSLEQSSFNAWIKLYRPDENSKNSSVSYYLKGGLVFNVLHAHLVEQGKSVDDLLRALWEDYKKRPEVGVTRDDVYRMVKEIGGESLLDIFSTMVETTEDIDFDSAFKKLGLELKWNENPGPWLGIDWEWSGDRAIAKTVLTDSPAYKAGINAGDELLFLNGYRFLKEDAERLNTILTNDNAYEFIGSRLGKLIRFEVIPTSGPRTLREISVVDRKLAEKAFSFLERPAPSKMA